MLNLNDINFSKFVFIHYAPCTFGSTLFHLLMKTGFFNTYEQYNTERIYTDKKTAHNNILNVISDIHSYDQIQIWKELNDVDKKLFLQKNLIKDIVFNDLYQPPLRLAYYDCFYEIKNFFKNSKHIVITFNRTDIKKLVAMYSIKLKADMGVSILPQYSKLYKNIKNEKIKNNIEKKSETEIYNYFHNVLNSINPSDTDFMFPFDSFFNYKSFEQTSLAMFKSLQIENSIDLEIFWNEFYNNNSEFFT